MIVGIMCGMTHICGNIVVTWLLDDAYLSMRCMTSLLFATAVLMEGILAPKKLAVRSSSLVFTGPHCLKILTIFVKAVTSARELERF